MMQTRHHHSRPTVRRSAALLACAALTIAACGGDDDDADLTTPDLTTSDTEPDVTEPTAPETTEPDVTEPTTPETTEPEVADTTEPDTTTGETAPPTSEVLTEGVVCAASEEGGPLDLEALAEMDPASALGQIDDASTFLFAANEAGLIDRLESDDELTFFVPTDDAFDQIPEDELEPLLSDPVQLSSLILDHIVLGRYTSADLEDGTTLPTATEGQEWLVNVTDDGEIMVAGSAATVVCPDIETANAVIHLIDRVVITPGGIG